MESIVIDPWLIVFVGVVFLVVYAGVRLLRRWIK